jgi:hypothetical protein
MDQAATTTNPTERAADEAAILSGYGCGEPALRRRA